MPFQGLLYVYDYQNDVDTESYAGFLHIDYKFTDHFSATLGGRYSDETKKFIGGQADLNGFSYKITRLQSTGRGLRPLHSAVDPAGVDCRRRSVSRRLSQPLRYFPAEQQEQTFTEFTPEVGLTWTFSDDAMTYVKYSEGFKSGGWTTRLSRPITDGTFAEFKPERAESYELGLKSVFLDNRFLVNTAIFYTDYDDIQLNFQEGASPVLRNAGKARLQGIEVESQAVLGGGFGFTFAGGYIDAKYTEVTAIGITTDSKLPKTPECKINVGPDSRFGPRQRQQRAVLSRLHVHRRHGQRLSEHEPTSTSGGGQSGMRPFATPRRTTSTNSRSGGTNLTDERYLVTGSINEAAGEHTGTYSPPRQWYMQVRVNVD